ncbi:pyruvate kinase [Candidatus Falkowbacteria bacterium RIFOXYB2_FULL_38_15]|uniref:Pyruvate kinase n=1 Tax=Candidatus Falkowbacteria bacterium RIFOXYA2_FULL_38_12 TaxID=1797993 RepID=A0A1F5S4J9_9BACT|nr:MAG: pyruvate kinase [Candidatus Falkowbacteria bacterium RIFOXYA2_FULL_38_12]OGF32726.1 MAG: pyruvate kinase [Candidatus Falkowbacteria bacterium RIFOXYB2_FULL_38_15]OGF42238.1 MAG: pyruvate kinase [Candidatus Falkowbacteria bacterium RIFOXYD2_FULL_39_16]
MNKRTKIVCTIGPSSESVETLTKMLKAGMNTARLNFSHGNHAWHQKTIKKIRTISKKFDEPIGIIADLQGPRIRVGELPEKEIKLTVKEHIVITTNPKKTKEKILITGGDFHKDLSLGDRILLDEGLLELKVLKISSQDIFCEVVVGGMLTSHKGVNFPDTKINIPSFTKKDKEDLEFAVSQNVDWVALSFVSEAREVYDVKYFIRDIEKKFGRPKNLPIRIIVKIEKNEAIKNFDEILEATDGIMIARGDLGLEAAAEDVPLFQKKIIDKCLEAAKPVIVATQMLDSMIRKPRPTRAEVSDVANAVIDHTDAVMLSGETASGLYPVLAVATMTKIIEKIEASAYDDLVIGEIIKKIKPVDEAVGRVANILARTVEAKAILAASLSGYAGRIVCRYRPELPVFVSTDSKEVEKQLALSWGTIPFVLPSCRSVEELVDRSIAYIKKKKFIKRGDKIIIIAGEPVGKSGNINLIEIKEIV